MFASPGKKKRRLSTVRAIDCSLTTSMDWPMSTVLGMLPRVPLTYSATSWTVNICSNSSKISGKLFNSAAWGREAQQENRKGILYGTCGITCFKGATPTCIKTLEVKKYIYVALSWVTHKISPKNEASSLSSNHSYHPISLFSLEQALTAYQLLENTSSRLSGLVDA